MSELQPGNTPKTESQKVNIGNTHASGAGIVIGDGSSVNVFFEVVAAGTLGPLITAFCTELGKRLGGSAADWAKRVRLCRRSDDPATTFLQVEQVERLWTLIEIGEDLSDEAKLALLDLDVKSDAVRGQQLKWDEQSQKWLPKSGINTQLKRQLLTRNAVEE
jgi:hypothetical protein